MIDGILVTLRFIGSLFGQDWCDQPAIPNAADLPDVTLLTELEHCRPWTTRWESINKALDARRVATHAVESASDAMLMQWAYGCPTSPHSHIAMELLLQRHLMSGCGRMPDYE